MRKTIEIIFDDGNKQLVEMVGPMPTEGQSFVICDDGVAPPFQHWVEMVTDWNPRPRD